MSRKARQERRRDARQRGAAGATAPNFQTFTGATIALVVTLLASLGACIYVLTYRPVSDPDTWFHLAIGKWMLANRAFPHVDPFSFTAGNTPYVPSGWMGATILAWLDGFSPDKSLGPILMVTVVIALASLIVLYRGWRAGSIAMTALLLMAGLTAAVSRFSPRPDVFSSLGLTALLALLSTSWLTRDDDDPPPRPWLIWLTIPLMILWANLHAGVLVALPFLATYAGWALYQWSRTRASAHLHQAIPAVLACFAWLLNPYGAGLVGLAQRIADTPRVEWVTEWMPLLRSTYPMPAPALWMIGAMIAVVVATILKRGWRAFHPLELLWIALLTGLMLWQRRQVGLFAFAVPLLMARHLVPAELWLRAMRWPAFAAPVALATLTAWLQISGANGNGGGRPNYGRLATVLPCVTAEYIAAVKPPQPIFNPYGMGGYFIERLQPEYKVFLDGRLDVYPHQVWLDFLSAEEGKLSIDEIAARYQLQTFIVRADESYGDNLALATRLAARQDFALVHVDDYAAVFVRWTPDTAAWLESNALQTLRPWDLKAMITAAANPATRKAMISELEQLRGNFGESATVVTLAAIATAGTGDSRAASELLSTAKLMAPHHRLVRQAMALASRGWK